MTITPPTWDPSGDPDASYDYQSTDVEHSKLVADLEQRTTETFDSRVVAPGASCRTQIADQRAVAEEPPTPIEVIAETLSVDIPSQ